jgi:PAS domain S-box-containing protein
MRPTLKNLFLLFVAVLAVVNVGNYLVVGRAFENAEERDAAVRRTQQVLRTEMAFLRHLVDAETGQRGYLLTSDPAYLQPYTSAKSQALHDFARLSQLTQSPSGQKRLRAIEQATLEKLAEMQDTVDLHQHGQHERALALVKQNTGRTLMLSIRGLLAQFSAEEAEQLKLRESASAQAWRSAVRWYIVTNLFVCALIVAAFLFLRWQLLRPLQQLSEQLAKLGEGTELAEPQAVHATQELSQLFGAFSSMALSLKDKQQALHEAAREYVDLYNNAPCGYHSLDPAGVVRRINDTELRWLGYTREEVVDKKTIIELLTPESLAQFKQRWPDFIRDGQITDIQATLLCKGGTTLPVLVNATALKNERGELVLSRSVVLEHGRLRREREDKEAVLNSEAVGFAIIAGRVVRWTNAAGARLLGYEPAEVRDRDVSIFLADGTQVGSRGQQRFRKKDGTVRWFDVSRARLPSDPSASVWSFVDIDALKRTEAELVLGKDRAEAQSQAKSDFLANMSHEIRSPLNAMLGLAYLLEQTPLQPQQRGQLTKLRVAGQTLLGLINDVLDLAKIEAGELSVERAPFSISKLVEELYAVQVSAAENKRLRLEVENEWSGTDSSLDVLVGDVQHLRQVLLNLLNNAVKFTERGSVRFTVEKAQQPAAAGAVRLLFKVRDSGIGIDAETVPKLFQRFTQADSSTTRRFGGTGLGLSIVKQLSVHMGGRVWVESEKGSGSCFFVELPFELASEADRGALGQRALPLEVIIAEDDAAQRESLIAMARNLGWRVEAVGDGAELYERVVSRVSAGRPPDCLIVDWQMPTLDGLQALQRLSDKLGAQHVPSAVVITAHELAKLNASAQAGLPDSVLVKRVSSSDLFNAVNTAVIKRSGRKNLVLEGSLVDRAPVAWLPDVHVLLVDDSELNLEVAGSILRRQGAVVSTAHNGAAALAWLEANADKVDIVLMDVQMPVMDGNTAVCELRKQPKLAKLPVVALTAGALLRERTKALAAGMNDFLTKPFEPENIVRVVRQLVEQARGAPLGTAARQNLAGQQDWPEIAGIDSEDARARLGGCLELFSSGLRRMLQEYGDLQTPPKLPTSVEERAALSGRMHKLVGNSGMLGARDMHALAKTIEQRLRAAEDDGLQRLLAELGQQFVALARAAAPHLADLDEARREQDAAQRESPDVLDAAALLKFRDQLAQNDFAVLATFKELAPALRGALTESVYLQIERAIQALDFKAALAVLDAIDTSLAG